MIFDASVDGRTLRVEVRARERGATTSSSTGAPLEVDAASTAPASRACSWTAGATRSPSSRRTAATACTFPAAPWTSRSQEARGGARAAARRASGPARLIGPHARPHRARAVAAGADVAAGQGLVVIEAMKMENELRAPRAGRVARGGGPRGPGGRGRRAPGGGRLGARVSRRRKLLVVALVARRRRALYALWRAPEWGARLVESTLSRRLQARRCTSRRCGVRPGTLELELRGLRVGRPHARRRRRSSRSRSVRVRPSLAPLRGDRIVLSRVRIEGPALCGSTRSPRRRSAPAATTSRSSAAAEAAAAVQVSIERLVIVGGEFVLDHAAGPARPRPARLPRPAAGRAPRAALAGHLSFEPGPAADGRRPGAAGRHRDRRASSTAASLTVEGGAARRREHQPRLPGPPALDRPAAGPAHASRAPSTSRCSSATCSAPASASRAPRAGTGCSRSTARGCASRGACRARAGSFTGRRASPASRARSPTTARAGS